VIEATRVTVELGGRAVVDDVDLATVDGRVVGLIGPNGSGKSTLLRCMCAALAPSGGAVMLAGRGISEWSTREVAQQVAVVPQEQVPATGLTVAELVLLGRAPHRRDHQGFTASDHDMVATALGKVGALDLASRRWHELSGGERQRVALARCLAQGSAALLLDEPTNHLDVRYQHEVLALVRSLGLTTIVVLHDLNLAARYCDHLVLIDDGRVVRSGDVDHVLDPVLLADVYGIAVRRIDDHAGPVMVFG
jgi:iron complex transport system ATP-binding protein